MEKMQSHTDSLQGRCSLLTEEKRQVSRQSSHYWHVHNYVNTVVALLLQMHVSINIYIILCTTLVSLCEPFVWPLILRTALHPHMHAQVHCKYRNMFAI